VTERPLACPGWEADLSALIDGELDAARESALRAHLAGCEACAARLASLGRVDALLAATPLPEVSPALRERVLGLPGAEPAPVRRAPPRRRRWLAPLAAAAAAAALALYLALRPPEGPAEPEPPLAEEPPRPEDLEPLEPPPTLIAEPMPPPAMPPPPEPEFPRFAPELELPDGVLAGAPSEEEPLLAELESEPVEDLAVVLFGAEEPDDVDVIANLEILERLLALEGGRG